MLRVCVQGFLGGFQRAPLLCRRASRPQIGPHDGHFFLYRLAPDHVFDGRRPGRSAPEHLRREATAARMLEPGGVQRRLQASVHIYKVLEVMLVHLAQRPVLARRPRPQIGVRQPQAVPAGAERPQPQPVLIVAGYCKGA